SNLFLQGSPCCPQRSETLIDHFIGPRHEQHVCGRRLVEPLALVIADDWQPSLGNRERGVKRVAQIQETQRVYRIIPTRVPDQHAMSWHVISAKDPDEIKGRHVERKFVPAILGKNRCEGLVRKGRELQKEGEHCRSEGFECRASGASCRRHEQGSSDTAHGDEPSRPIVEGHEEWIDLSRIKIAQQWDRNKDDSKASPHSPSGCGIRGLCQPLQDHGNLKNDGREKKAGIKKIPEDIPASPEMKEYKEDTIDHREPKYS